MTGAWDKQVDNDLKLTTSAIAAPLEEANTILWGNNIHPGVTGLEGNNCQSPVCAGVH